LSRAKTSSMSPEITITGASVPDSRTIAKASSTAAGVIEIGYGDVPGNAQRLTQLRRPGN